VANNLLNLSRIGGVRERVQSDTLGRADDAREDEDEDEDEDEKDGNRRIIITVIPY